VTAALSALTPINTLRPTRREAGSCDLKRGSSAAF
jgi:hypothetical protein